MVQAWPMPFRVPGAGVLGTCPGTPLQHAYFAGTPPNPAPFQQPTPAPFQQQPDVWNHQAMLAALATYGVPPSGPQATEWFLDTGATSHMASQAGNFPSSQPLPHSAPITVGNGALLPVTHRASSTIATSKNPLSLKNILVSPSLVKNLLSIRSLTRDNNVTVKFDAFGFSIKDIPTRTVLLRCNSAGDLYPLASTSPSALVAAAPSVDLWHQRLGHPGRSILRQSLPQLEFTCYRSMSHSCHACQFGKHTRLPFKVSNSVSHVPFQIVHADVWTSPVSSCSSFKYYLVLIDDLTHYVWTFPL
jgi:hypothetical protein